MRTGRLTRHFPRLFTYNKNIYQINGKTKRRLTNNIIFVLLKKHVNNFYYFFYIWLYLVVITGSQILLLNFLIKYKFLHFQTITAFPFVVLTIKENTSTLFGFKSQEILLEIFFIFGLLTNLEFISIDN